MNLDWQDSALCAQVGTGFHFPEKGDSTRVARFLCRRCPVRTECLEYALDREGGPDAGPRWGIWGGLSARERQQLAHERAAGGAAA